MPRVSGALTVIISILAFLTFFALRPSPLPQFGLLFPTLTSLFITSTSVIVAYVAVRAYARERLLMVLFLGCGALVFGSTCFFASAFLGLEAQNFSATIFAIGALVSAFYNLACAALTYLAHTPRLGRRYHVYLWISVALVSVILGLVISFEGLLPPFYDEATGTTVLGRIVLGAASVAFASSAALIFVVFSSSRSDVLYWYSLALGAIAAGLVGVLVSSGDIRALPIRAGWVAFYLAGVLLLKSVLSAETLAHSPVATGNDRL